MRPYRKAGESPNPAPHCRNGQVDEAEARHGTYAMPLAGNGGHNCIEGEARFV
jgi:hypothetical protein